MLQKVTIHDLFNYWLSGEFTNTKTTQYLDSRNRNGALPMLQAMDIPAHLFGPVTDSGTPIGTLLPRVAEETEI